MEGRKRDAIAGVKGARRSSMLKKLGWVSLGWSSAGLKIDQWDGCLRLDEPCEALRTLRPYDCEIRMMCPTQPSHVHGI
jgi:hypothetical protein